MARKRPRLSPGALALKRIGAPPAEMASRLGISERFAARLLSGERNPSDALKTRIKKQYGVDWDAPAPPKPKRRASESAPALTEIKDDAVRAQALGMLQTVRDLQREIQDDEDIYPEKKAKVLASCAATLASLGRLTGESMTLSESQIVRHPQFRRIVASLWDALAPWPDAFAAAVEALRRFE